MLQPRLAALLGFLLVLLLAAGVQADRLSVTPVVGQTVGQPAPAARDACLLAKTNYIMASYFGGFESGMINVTYFNPETCGFAPTYPFEIINFGFTLFDDELYDMSWPVQVDVVVYDVAQTPDSCTGPGAELCRVTALCDSLTYCDPNFGYVTFPAPCCVDGPFFIGIEYTDDQNPPMPSLLYDDQVSDTCDNWFYYDGVWYEWFDIWTAPPPGYPVFEVNGETNSPGCEPCTWQPGDPHKMHFPQLPDEDGWDVNATQPLVLADDWRCSQTGWIKDLHWWGSWKDGLEGEILYFVLSIHEDIPADPPQIPYSRPGTTLWELDVANFDVIPFDPPTMEGWYDPSTGEVLPDNHQAYFQYNVCLDSLDWFYQEQDTIYWLNISAVLADPQETQWGWKSTEDHFQDDAVWAFWGELNWIDIWEPYVPDPISNAFNITINQLGELVEGWGDNAYGDGWYYYPWYDWWNVWFYDHPFDENRYKMGYIEFEAFPYEAGPSWMQVAVNWSTDTWAQDFPDTNSPPLPGTNEDLYIGRQILYETEFPGGFNRFDFVIPEYNPEWVSVDVRGYNFVIPQGIIEHECVGQQSLDLAFVVTGGVDTCDCEPGNCNGDNVINILDVTYLISYLYKGGPAPIPYALCSGDPDCNCIVNILDVTYLISFLYKGGPPPCDCNAWLSACGAPLRK